MAAQKTILVFGDSLSAGYGLGLDQAWPSLLAQRLAQEKSDYRVVNASVSGDTTAGGRSRLPAALQRYQPSLVIIALGGNDGLRGLPVRAMQENLAAMARASREAGARVLLLGLDMPPNYGPQYREKFRAAYAEAARQEGAALVPFMLGGFAERTEYFLPDRIHPTAAAQPLILDTVWRVLRPMLKEDRRLGQRS